MSAPRTNAPSTGSAGASTSLRQRLEAMRHLPALLRLVWATSPPLAATLLVLRVVRAFVPVAVLWIGKLIIDGVLAARADGAPWQSLLGLLGLEIALVLAGEWLARGSALVEGLLGERFSNRVSVQLMEHAATLDLAQFEDAEFYDSLERARRQTTARIGLVAMLLQTGQSALTLATLGAALLAFSPVLVLLLVVAVLPGFLSETRFAAMEYSMLWRRTPERRRLDYLRDGAASSPTAKEVQLFGLADWLTARFKHLADRWYEENRQLSQRKALVGSALVVISTLGYYVAYAFIIARTVQGAITLGSLTFLAGSFARGRDLVQSILGSASSIYEQSLYLRDLFVFFDRKATITSHPGAPGVPGTLREGFVFDGVGFRYPGSERWAIRDVSFRIRPGERLALVGENGAGKTTITKLLARLYDPTEGRVLLDGRDLREYDLASVRRAIGVIFQDFVRYDLRFDENIAIGGIEDMRDYLASVEEGAASRTDGTARIQQAAAADDSHVPGSIRSAAERSLATSLLPRLPAGYAQMLGRRFEGGVDLSGGEWQKVALARAWMRDAHLLILDEPTAALDARAEYEVFVRFSELVAGRMAVLISHRFSTVRMADRILVLTGGQLVEEGSHEQLVAAGGLYAELFQMQAAGYR
ncbi:MAG TPA: ABC transporter ATP-binding protein [Gemmatimonadaceae bacterium]|nr:ABC transporter ATP-binding protein [Gemmatimonadaceae bacterium]